jgi:hypothetical protein
VALAASLLLLLGGAALLYIGLVQTAPTKVAVDIPCTDVVAGCVAPGDTVRITFDQAPKSMKPFRLRVEVANAREVHAGFAMRGMQMGLNRYRLLAGAPGVWQAEITLPVCTNGRGDWIMTLEIDGRLYQLPFGST